MNVKAAVHEQALTAVEERAVVLKQELARVRSIEQTMKQAITQVNIMKSVNKVIQTFITFSSNRIISESHLIEGHDSLKSPGTAEVPPKASVTEGDGSAPITELGNQLLAVLEANNIIAQANKNPEPPAPAQHHTD